MVHPLSDRLLRSWLRCRRKAWLDRHGDPAERLWNPHRALQLADREKRLQQCIDQPLERCTGTSWPGVGGDPPLVIGST